jgi:prepilin-type N-terminal cleavage/methylation domain-containing protein
MDRRVLSPGGDSPRRAERGFTMIEIVVAMAVTIVVMLANLYMFNTAQKDLAFGKSLTNATNLATGKIDDFKTQTIPQIKTAAPDVQASPNPLDVRRGTDTVTLDGVAYTRTWTVSDIDLENAAVNPVAELVGDLVKIKVDVAWSAANKGHHVTMATFTTGKAP